MSTQNSIDSQKPIQTALGGTGIASPTAHKLLVGNGSSALTQIAVGTTGQVLLGNTSADPSFGAVPLGSPNRFSAYNTSAISNVTGDGTSYTLVCDSTFFDSASAYSTSTGQYTVPTTGVYVFGGCWFTAGYLSGHTTFGSSIYNGAGSGYHQIRINPQSILQTSEWIVTWTQVISTTSGTLVYPSLQVSGSTKVISIQGNASTLYGTTFWGYQIA